MLKNLNPNFAIILSTLLWGTWWYPLRLMNEIANNNAIPLFLSFSLAGIFLLVLSFKDIKNITKQNVILTIVAASAGAAAMCLYNEGLLRGNVARILIFFYLTSVWSTLIEIFFMKQGLTIYRVFSIICGFGGMFVMMGIDQGNYLPSTLADFFGVLSGLLWSVCATLIRVNTDLRVNFATSVFILMGGVFVILAVLLPGGQIIEGFTYSIFKNSILIILVFGFLWILPGYWLVTMGQDQVDPGRAGILLMFEVLIGVVSAYLLANEVITIREFLGAILILSAPLIELYASKNSLKSTS